MKIYMPLLAVSISLLASCSDIQHVKLSHDYRTECFATYTVRCTDVKVKLMILETQAGKDELIDNEARAIREMGRENYEKVLDLLDQKIRHLKSERPNFLLRWFKSEEEYPFEIDTGWRIDAQIEILGKQILQSQTAITAPPQPQPTADTQETSNETHGYNDEAVLAAITAPVQTADEANAEADEAAKRDAEAAMQDALASTQPGSEDND